VKLFRAMIADSDGQPLVGRSARKLGIRTPRETNDPNVTAIADNELIQPGTGGLLTAPDEPANLPPFRRPPKFGGRGKDPVWQIDTNDLGPDLLHRLDGATHALVEPIRPMQLKEYETH
jgi:hypothetical protein